MKLLKSNLLIVILIILIGFGIRIYKLDSVPPGLTWDEAALGYNAYSILKTGRDEYGSFLPLTLKSFGDYKPALYAYLDIPFIAILGLNEWAVRLPSVLAGVGFILLMFLITQHIFRTRALSLLVALFAAISPLSIQFSRVGFESNVALFLNMLGFYLFLKGIEKSRYFYGSAVAFSLSMLCYQASKLFVPILLLGLFIFFKSKVKPGRNLFLSLVMVVTVGISVFLSTFALGSSDRLATQNIFSYKRDQSQLDQILKEEGLGSPDLKFQIFHGDWWHFTGVLLEHYLTYFSPDILFVKGDYSPRHSVPGMGILNYYAIILVPVGFYYLLKRKEYEKKIIFFWLLTAAIPAVFSRDLISMVRALNLAFPFVILEGLGFYFLVNKLSQIIKLNKILVSSLVGIIILINLAIYFDSYFTHLPKDNSQGWLYGYKQIISKLPETSKYDKVVFTDYYGQPYIYYLFYTKYSPRKYQQQALLDQKTVDVGTVRHIDNINFRSVDYSAEREVPNTLFVGTELEIPESILISQPNSKKLGEVNFLDELTAFRIVENSNE